MAGPYDKLRACCLFHNVTLVMGGPIRHHKKVKPEAARNCVCTGTLLTRCSRGAAAWEWGVA